MLRLYFKLFASETEIICVSIMQFRPIAKYIFLAVMFCEWN